MTEQSFTIPAIPEARSTDVFMTREFNAPRTLVWRFFTEPELLAQWFGPTEVHVDPATVRVELHPGGSWDLDMVDNKTGEHYPLRSRLRVVIAPEYLEGGEVTADSGVGPLEGITLRIWLQAQGEKTLLTLHQGPFTSEFREMTRLGWEASFTKIDAIIAAGLE